jgi:hypothetical protein
MLCSLSRTTGTGISANAADAEGGTIDAEVAPRSWVMVPESLLTPLPRHVMADSCTGLSSSKVPGSNTQQLLRGKGST